MTNYRILSISCLYICAIAFASCDRFISKPIVPKNSESKTSLELPKQIKAIAVKVIVDRAFGSGAIVKKEGKTYTVVTNRHVANRSDNYQIQTSDRQIYLGKLQNISQQDDLAILEFNSDRFYPVAKINSAPLKIKDYLFSAGFPFNSDRLQITSGRLLLKTHKPLKQGYQLGYTNFVEKGMSGGAIINTSGEVVGVNGRSADPIVPDYQYQDLSYPTKHLQQKMIELSWGIPITKVIELID